MYEVMSVWETMDLSGKPAVMQDYASLWQAADKIVFSKTLDATSTSRTRLERSFDPAAIRALKESATRDISVSGPDLAAQAIEAGLVDEFQLFLTPVIVGGGTRYLPDGVFASLELLDQHRFDNGVVHLHYRRT
jgi:dihydrofolate reductase